MSISRTDPFTTNAGFIGFKASENVAGGTKWFVWATATATEGMPAPALRLEGGSFFWEWGWNPTGGGDVYQSYDGGVTWNSPVNVAGSERSYATTYWGLPTFVVGINSVDSSEATGRSGVVTPETPWVPSVPVEPKLRKRLRFVTVLEPGALAALDLVSIATPYLAAVGSWHGPGLDGEWPEPTFVWFRLHQYANGQLSPGMTLRGQVQVEL